MRPSSPDPPGSRAVDYRPTRCRCGAVILPHNVWCSACGREQNLFFVGLDRLYEKDLDKLLHYHRSEVEGKPGDFMRLFQLAGVYLLRNEYETARDIYRKVVELEPEFADARLNLGGVLASLGEKDDAVDQLQEFVKLDLHSPRVERVIKAICAIRNIPYEDALKETAPKEFESGMPVKHRGAKISSTGKPVLRGARYISPPPPKPMVKKRAWGAIDIFLLLVICIGAAAWFIFPSQSQDVINSTVKFVEGKYRFTVTTNPPEGYIDENAVAGEEAVEEEPEPEIINLDPAIDSYFPMAVGYKWEYFVFDTRDPDGYGPRSQETTQEMTVEQFVDADKGLWKLLNGPNPVYYTERRTGVYAGSDSRGLWSTLFIQLPLPAEVGKTITQGGQTATVIGTEVLVTSAGKIECVKVHIQSSRPVGTEWYSWYGRGIGLVKYVGGGRDGVYHVRELKSFELD